MIYRLLVLASISLGVASVLNKKTFVDSSCFQKARQSFCSSHFSNQWIECLQKITQTEDLIYVNETTLCHSTLDYLCIVEDFCGLQLKVKRNNV